MAKHRSDLIQAIREAEVFLVIFDEFYLKAAETYVQIELAKQMNKPFRVLVKKGVKIARGTFDGVKDIKYRGYSGKESMLKARDILLNDFFNETKGNGCIEFVDGYEKAEEGVLHRVGWQDLGDK